MVKGIIAHVVRRCGTDTIDIDAENCEWGIQVVFSADRIFVAGA